MKNFSLGPILLLILFVVIPLVNYFLNRRARRFEQPTAARQPMADMGFRRQAASRAAPEPVHMTAPKAEIPPRRARAPRRGRFMTRREMRRAIILMTVLGPCRANEPPE